MLFFGAFAQDNQHVILGRKTFDSKNRLITLVLGNQHSFKIEKRDRVCFWKLCKWPKAQNGHKKNKIKKGI